MTKQTLPSVPDDLAKHAWHLCTYFGIDIVRVRDAEGHVSVLEIPYKSDSAFGYEISRQGEDIQCYNRQGLRGRRYRCAITEGQRGELLELYRKLEDWKPPEIPSRGPHMLRVVT